LLDRKLLIGVGIGMIISTIIMAGVKINYQMSDEEVIMRARKLNMQFPSEMKAIYWEDNKSND